MAASQSFTPRIYYLDPYIAGAEASLKQLLARCAGMGFDHILVPSHARKSLRTLAELCAGSKLSVIVDLDISELCADRDVVAGHPEWFAADDEDALPDPRRPIAFPSASKKVRYGADTLEPLAAYWQQRLTNWAEAGAAGFRCMELTQAPAEFWRRLIVLAKQQVPALRFLAWTPGCSAQQVAALRGCGFDATFSSCAWWDYRSHWLAEEYSRLAETAPPIALVDTPSDATLVRHPGYDDMSLRERLFRRSLQLASCIGHGMLVPMGFEYGLSGIVDDVQGEADFGVAREEPACDLAPDIREANAFILKRVQAFPGCELHLMAGEESGGSLLLLAPAERDREALLVAANPSLTEPADVEVHALLEHADGYVGSRQVLPEQSGDEEMNHEFVLKPGELKAFSARRMPHVVAPASRTKAALSAASRAPRIAVESITPSVDGGRFAIKRVVGEVADIEADVFMDGHDRLAVALVWKAADEDGWHELRMRSIGNDRWSAALPLTRVGRYLFAVEAWHDKFETYRNELEKKSAAGLDVSLEIEEGRLLVEAAAGHAESKDLKQVATSLKALAKSLKAPRGKAADNNAGRIAALLAEPTAEAMRLADPRPFAVRSEPVMRIEVDRVSARFSSWYELFPRSQSGDPARHGTFDDVIRRLPHIRAMGFDTLYFPPIHPIGRKNRKGRNNSLTPGTDDPGSPYAIGSEDGGHDAIHPQLGTIADFRRLRDEAAKHGMDLALDFAIQCSPDHPWLKEHPEWFDWRPDGSIRYAENPPKKYEDIVNVDFYAEGAIPGLWNALRDVILYWVKEGVRTFRVDNPHTKAFPFWEWMIADVRSRYPDVVFLSEAFTRPRPMYRLAKIGFTQSYTYFTWRHTKQEFIDYMTELNSQPVCEFFRPHFFVNTPDINPPFLQKSGRPGHLIRAALAATLSGLWGMYSGFELCEATPVPGKEEYLDSEKYEIRAWDWNRPGNIIAEITQLNRIRRENPALQSHLGIRFLPSSDDNVLFFAKSTKPLKKTRLFGDNVVLAAINLDPFNAHDTRLELPLWQLGLPDDGRLEAVDLVNGNRIVWQGRTQHLRLDPSMPYAIWRLEHRRV